MSTGNNSYAFCADYSDIAACVAAIQTLADNGGLAGDAEAQRLLGVFSGDAFAKLYNRIIAILSTLDGIVIGPADTLGDFEDADFESADFVDDVIIMRGLPDFSFLDFSLVDFNAAGRSGSDFSGIDFSSVDFSVILPDFDSRFQTVVNIFQIFCSRSSELSPAMIRGINAAFVPVLNAFQALQQYLVKAGINPCVPGTNIFTNSDSLQLQAAGADGSFGYAAGIHLRWTLAGDLGTNHLPKGNYDNGVSTPSGYNRANDFVNISRTPYTNPAILLLDFSSAVPAIDLAAYSWTYILNYAVNGIALTSIVRLVFTDPLQYRRLSAGTDPSADPLGFLTRYAGIIGLRVDQKNVFALDYDFRLSPGTASGLLKLEAATEPLIDGAITPSVIARATTNIAETGRLVLDNMAVLLIQSSSGSFLQSLSLETYDDFVHTRSDADWVTVGSGFALSTDDTTVFDRLQNEAYTIDNIWPQYNDGTKVRVANYQAKWNEGTENDPAVKTMLGTYLSLSETDPRAMVTLQSDAVADGDLDLRISYLDIINLLATDFHWARMLGLGTIDTGADDDTSAYIYQASYTNRAALASPELTNYTYMTPPVSRTDLRLPATPVQRPLAYQLPVNSGQSSIYDDEGYAQGYINRLVNIGRLPFPSELDGSAFFATDLQTYDFNTTTNGDPALFGIEYRGPGDTAYEKPEITSVGMTAMDYTLYYAWDDDHPDGGVLETVLVPDNADSLYIHFEKTSGTHAYALYGVNLFARSSAVSNELEAVTVFAPLNNLVPPAAVAVQYIQDEDPLLFTTPVEQGWLSNRDTMFPGADTSFTRITFNWLDLLDVSDNRGTPVQAERVKALFKYSPLQGVAGQVAQVVPVPGDDSVVLLFTIGYTALDGTAISPQLASADFFKFTGSLLTTPTGQFTVVSAAVGTDGPVFTVQKMVQTISVEDSANPGTYGSVDNISYPAVGDRFTVTENLAQAANWSPVQEDIQLVVFPPVDELIYENGVLVQTLQAGGISGEAVITPLNDTTGQLMPGYYAVAYDAGVNLAPHPQINPPDNPANAPGALHTAHVEWYNGLARLKTVSGGDEKKLVPVIRILQTEPLVVFIYDAGYADDPILVSAGGTVKVPGANFHPGYRTYFLPEPAPDYTLNGGNILPGADRNDRQTLLGLEISGTGSDGLTYYSAVSAPSVLLARKIVLPVLLDAPVIYNLKVRPDATTRAALTMDIWISPDAAGNARSPYGFMFYRTDNADVLEALYAPLTLLEIQTDLAALTVDESYNERYLELVNIIYDPNNPGEFRVFDALPMPYGFPVPDRPDLVNPTDTQDQKTAKYHAAIISTLLPLSARPPIYGLLTTGTQTENKQPVIRSVDGNLLPHSDPNFDPFPMVRLLPNPDGASTNYVRFTDYTLYGSSRFLYFYACAEISQQLAIGPVSPFAGGVTILDTTPADPPLVRKFTLGPPATDSTSPIAVTFYLSPFFAEDPISKVRLYRADDADKAIALQMMDNYVDMPVVYDADGGLVLEDDFSDLPAVPFGDVIYYRLAFIRTINNERNVDEDIIGSGSSVLIVTLIDIVNPDAPQLVYNGTILNWLPTANKGIYYLYNQNSKGNWQLLTTIGPPDSSITMGYDTGVLPPTDPDGNTIYYRYKVRVQNSSGLFNLSDNELTITGQ